MSLMGWIRLRRLRLSLLDVSHHQGIVWSSSDAVDRTNYARVRKHLRRWNLFVLALVVCAYANGHM
jgi:hypothetical protein